MYCPECGKKNADKKIKGKCAYCNAPLGIWSVGPNINFSAPKNVSAPPSNPNPPPGSQQNPAPGPSSL